jgi:hypothetical protein
VNSIRIANYGLPAKNFIQLVAILHATGIYNTTRLKLHTTPRKRHATHIKRQPVTVGNDGNGIVGSVDAAAARQVSSLTQLKWSCALESHSKLADVRELLFINKLDDVKTVSYM